AEIFAAWAVVATHAGMHNDDLDAKMSTFLVRVGRRKFLTPTYKALMDAGRQDFAVHVYAQARPGYHAVAQETLDKLLGL
ncbi:MAG TPA: aminopeptidase, partial [Cryomorphaceae bacterium]|nr:aminopeptidase [Cryomorphaceae bacterium]